MDSHFKKYLMIGSALLLSACGGAPNSSSSNSPTNQDQGAVAPISTDLYNGFISSGIYENKQVLSVNIATSEFQISVPLGRNVSLTLVDTPVAQVPGAHAYTADLADGTKVLVLAIPLKYSLKNIPSFPKGVLPSGDPLPGAVPGPLATKAIALGGRDNVVLHLYFGADTLGIFVETNFDPYAKIQADILNKIQDRLGVLTFIPAKGGFRPGVYLSMTLPSKLARMLDPFIK